MITKYINMENRTVEFKQAVVEVLARMCWGFDEYEGVLCINVPCDDEWLFEFIFAEMI